MITKRRSFIAGLALMALVAAGCSSGGTPNIVGTWTGTATFPGMDGTVKTTPETLVIEKQDGALVWGTVEYEDATGTTKNQVIGTFTGGGAGLVLTEPASMWEGKVSDTTMTVTVSWLGAESHGAFEMTLTKKQAPASTGRSGPARAAAHVAAPASRRDLRACVAGPRPGSIATVGDGSSRVTR